MEPLVIELYLLKDIHVYFVLSVANRLRVSRFTVIIQDVDDPLIVNQNQISEQHSIGISLKLFQTQLVKLTLQDKVSLVLREPSLVNCHLV